MDDDTAESADADALNGGCLAVGSASYRTVLVPDCRHMPAGTIDVLRRFAENGGAVYAGKGNGIPGAADIRDFFEKNPPAPEGMRTMTRTLRTGRLYFIFNESDAEREYELPFAEKPSLRLCPETGDVFRVREGTGSVRLCSGETAVFAAGIPEPENTAEDAHAGAEPLYVFPENGWMFAPETEMRLTDGGIRESRVYREPCPVSSGDWREAVGDGFSGTCVYSAHFSLPEVPHGGPELDLGRVGHTASVRLNGTDLGIRLAPPYRFRVPAELLKRENVLEISVTNLPANQYACTGIFDKWKPWQIPYYFAVAKHSDREVLPSGLFGPVRLVL